MLPPDDVTRYLTPPVTAFPDDILGSETPLTGNIIQADDAPLSYPPEAYPQGSLPEPEQGGGSHDHDFGVGPLAPLKGLDTGSTGQGYSATLVKTPHGHFVPSTHAKHPSGKHHETRDKGGADGDKHHGDGHSHAIGQGGHKAGADIAHGPRDSVDGGITAPCASHSPAYPDDALADDKGSSITVKQFAIVDQDASILVSGYVGEVVAEVHIDQDLMMDQEVNIDLSIDGDGRFNLVLDQGVQIDQDVQIDIRIYDDNDGVLHVELYLHDAIEVNQDTDIDMSIGGGPPGGSVAINQDMELTQTVDIDIDIEDDLEERYLVNVQVETKQTADVDQDAIVDVKDLNGHTEMDVDAIQTAAVEQQTIVHADFGIA